MYGFSRQETRSGKNIFDLDKWFQNASAYNCTKELIQNGIKLVFTANTDAFVGTNMSGVGQTLGASYKNQLIEVKPSTKYTISLSSAPKCYVSQYNEDLTSVMFERIPANNNETQYTITTNSNTRYIGLRLGILDSSLTNYNFTNIQIEEGEVATDYEEYGVSPSPEFEAKVHCLGDDVNLFDKNGEVTNLYITDSGSEAVGAGSDQFIKQVFNSKDSNYIMSFDKNINNAYVRFTYYEGDTFISREISGANGYIFNVPKNCTKVDIRTNTIDKYFTNLKLQKGTIATAWSPYGYGTVETISENGSNTSSNIVYIDKPLCGIGNVRDELDYTNKKIIRRCKKIVFDGTEAGWQMGTYSGEMKQFYITVSSKPARNDLLSSHFPYRVGSVSKGAYMNTGSNLAVFVYPVYNGTPINTLNDWKTFLAEQYANGTPIEIVYKLATPTVEDIDCSDKITQYDEQTTVYNTDNAEIEVSLTNNKTIAQINQNLQKIEELLAKIGGE